MDIEQRQILINALAMICGGFGDLMLRAITGAKMFGYFGISLILTGISLLLIGKIIRKINEGRKNGGWKLIKIFG